MLNYRGIMSNGLTAQMLDRQEFKCKNDAMKFRLCVCPVWASLIYRKVNY